MRASSLLTRIALLSIVALAPSCKYLPFAGSGPEDPGIGGDTSGWSAEELAELGIQRGEQKRIAQLERDKADAAEELRVNQERKDALGVAAAKKKQEVAAADLKREQAKRRASRRKGSLRVGYGTPDYGAFLTDNPPNGLAIEVDNGSYFSFEAENGDMDGMAGIIGLSLSDGDFTDAANVDYELSLFEFYGGARFGKMLTSDFRIYADLGMDMSISSLDITTASDSFSSSSVGVGLYYGVGTEYYLGDSFSIWADYRALIATEHDFFDADYFADEYETQSIDYSRIAFGVGFTH